MDRQVVLVTGGAGFVGNFLAEKYLVEGHTVKILDDFSTGDPNNIRRLFNHRHFKLVRGDVRDYGLLQRVTGDVDVIFHLAAQIHVDKSIVDPIHTFEVNTLGTLNVLNVSLENDIKQVIYASSSEVYGSAQYTPMDEQHPLNPASPYAASKAAADRLCYSYYNTYKLNASIVRSFNTFGPRQKSAGYGGAISIFVDRVLSGLPPVIYGDGLQKRDYLYIEDAVEAYDLVFNSGEKLSGKAINFGSGEPITILDLARKIVTLCGKEKDLRPVHVTPRPGEVQELCADTSLARNVLGFKPKHTIEEGLVKFIDWYKGYRHEEWTVPG